MLENTTAVLVIWHDLLPEAKLEWEQCHTHEHMPERVGIPGFLGGRRYMNHDAPDQCCFTLYEGSDLSIFKSPPYLERLNNPTPWTKKNASAFKNLTRGACRCVSTSGPKNAYGGTMMTIRLLRSQSFSEDSEQLNQLTTDVAELSGVITATLALCDTEITSTETAERKLRKGTAEEPLDGVLMIEGYDAVGLKKEASKIQDKIKATNIHLNPLPHQIYPLSYMLRE